MLHTAPVNFNFNVLKFLRIDGNVTINGKHFLRSKKLIITNNLLKPLDTIYKDVSYILPDASTSASFYTNIYGLYTTALKNKIQFLHIMTPRIGFTYSTPLFEIKRYTDTIITSDNKKIPYIVVDDRGSGIAIRQSALLQVSINNRFEMKKTVNEKPQKTTIIDELSISSGYDLLADSFQWQNINVAARTSSRFYSISGDFSMDPYHYYYSTELQSFVRTTRLFIRNVNPHIHFITLSIQMTNIQLMRTLIIQGKEVKLPFSFSAGYTLRLIPAYSALSHKRIYTQQTSSFQFQFNLQLTEKWKIMCNGGYDLMKNTFTHTSLELFRDMHCWEFYLSVVPSGIRKSFVVEFRLKSPLLKELKLSRKREWIEE